MKCLSCCQELTEKYQLKFCNRSCAATYNGSHYPKRSKEKMNYPKCLSCDNKTVRKSGKYCRECIDNNKHLRGVMICKQTIEDACKRKGSNRYDMIRDNARRLFKNELKNPLCECCGYSKHVELCHKIPISKFPKDTLITEVNKRENVLFLCPNCHWEFDRLGMVLPDSGASVIGQL